MRYLSDAAVPSPPPRQHPPVGSQRVQRDETISISASQQQRVPELAPGETQLESFWAPGIPAGPQYRIQVSQEVTAKDGEPTLSLAAEKHFSVKAPQFCLPRDAVYAVYPAPGYTDGSHRLPHVVLANPHLPWERLGTTQPCNERTRAPWLALFTFTREELTLTHQELDGTAGIFQYTPSRLEKPVRQTSTLAVHMAVSDLLAVPPDPGLAAAGSRKRFATPVVADNDGEDRADFIFVSKELFTGLFPWKHDQNCHTTTRYQHLAHVQSVNRGNTSSKEQTDDVETFSVVVGSRCAPKTESPVLVFAHLVSIEGIEGMQFPVTEEYVALCSLHSWSYMAVSHEKGKDSEDLTKLLKPLGDTIGLLRASHIDRPQLRAIIGPLADGYCMVKHRTHDGKKTVALFRGPLTPFSEPVNAELNSCSSTGQDLQIAHPDVRDMANISYSAAWQLGRMLALGDQHFSSSLVRLRIAIHTTSMKRSKSKALPDGPGSVPFNGRDGVLLGLPDMANKLASLHGERPVSASNMRWRRRRLPKDKHSTLGFTTSEINKHYQHEAIEVARDLAETGNSGEDDAEAAALHSTDWKTVLTWILDRLFLAGIPAHYLISDPSHLELESLRFFHIDWNWMNAMVDGALSLGNHDMGFDKDRVAIKTALNDAIEGRRGGGRGSAVGSLALPTYGFYLRSDVVTMFPDLKVTVKTGSGDPIQAAVLRQEIVSDGIMMVLLDRAADNFERLTISQPPHQQRFVAGSFDPAQHPQISKPSFRLLHIPEYVDEHAIVMTSALLATKLSEPICSLTVTHNERRAANATGMTRPLRIPRLPAIMKPSDTTFGESREDDCGHQETESLCGSMPDRPQQLLDRADLAPHVSKPLRDDPDTWPCAKNAGRNRIFCSYLARVAFSQSTVHSLCRPTVHVHDNAPQDIVFHLRIDPNFDSRIAPMLLRNGRVLERTLLRNSSVVELAVRIPLGNDCSEFLMRDYNGAGPVMLGNPRFNVMLSTLEEGGKKELLVRVFPRNAKGEIPINQLAVPGRDVKVLLPLANINRSGQRDGWHQAVIAFVVVMQIPGYGRRTVLEEESLVTVIEGVPPH